MNETYYTTIGMDVSSPRKLLEFTHFFKATAIHLFSMSRFQSISAMMTFFLASINYPRSQDQFHECEKSVAFLLCFPVYYRLT